MLKKVLNRWGKYLQTEDSAQVLGTDNAGWFSNDGHDSLQYTANAAASTGHKFEDMFQCDPTAKYHGFKSWDGFFTRQFKEGIRPVEGDASVIVAPCESKPYNYAFDCKLRDKFWIKGETTQQRCHSCKFQLITYTSLRTTILPPRHARPLRPSHPIFRWDCLPSFS